MAGAISASDANKTTTELRRAMKHDGQCRQKCTELEIDNAELLRHKVDLLAQVKELKDYKRRYLEQADHVKHLTRQLQEEKKANQENLGFKGIELERKRRLNPELKTAEIAKFLRQRSGQLVEVDEDDDEEPSYGSDEIKDDPDGARTPSTPSDARSFATGSTPFTPTDARSYAAISPSSTQKSPFSTSTAPTSAASWTATASLRQPLTQPPSPPLFSPQTPTLTTKRKRKSDYEDDFDEEEHLKHERHRAIAATQKKVIQYPPYKPNQPLTRYPEVFEYELVMGWPNGALDPLTYPSSETPLELKTKVDRLLSDFSAIVGSGWLTKFEKLSYTLKLPVCVAAKVLGEPTVWHSTTAGEYACHRCSEMRQPCFSWDGKVFKLLPLRPLDNAQTFEAPRSTYACDDLDFGKWIHH